ncbi:MAG: cytidylate kinase-like family protein [Chloroflexi bacterium]|nr:cytidylate kinase-like family protein [Chloroflexota bacterium]MDA1218897.1 cytidylate kinase-like family protein [Chloroflexota bacterium]
MPVITINGPIGSGPTEVGQLVAQLMEINYVDRLVFAEAAKLVGSPVGAMIDKEQRVIRFPERLGRFLQTMLERSAISGVSGEPYFGRGIEMLPAETYTELAGDPSSMAQAVNDKAFLEATTSVIKDLAKAGNVVIIGRGSNIILADTPGVIHVGLVAPLSVRADTVMRREHFTKEEATAYVEELEQARITFFRKFFKVNANDPNMFHMVLNLGMLQQKTAAEVIVHTAGDIS